MNIIDKLEELIQEEPEIKTVEDLREALKNK